MGLELRKVLTTVCVLAMGLIGFAQEARANHHLMQIELVIGGVNGDTTAQAVQLRMRSFGQNVMSAGRLRAYDAAGLNPILLIDFTTNVSNPNTGARVLIATSSFLTKTTPNTTADYIMTNPIPASYLAAGKISFEADFNVIWWSLSYGGASYTGTSTGDLTNDANGNFGPAFAGPLPTTSLQALRFLGTATAASTSNSVDYALTTGAAVLSNNAGASFTVTGSPCTTPSVTLDPLSQSILPGQIVTLTVAATGTAPLSYQWRRNTGNLSDGLGMTGTNTDTLQFTVTPTDAGSYDAVVSNTCGSDTSAAAILSFPPTCGSADFDGDGDTGTDLDIEAFFACLGGDCCATCGSADFDGDGDTGTDLDIEAFFLVLGGGEC